jgi:hypothetical protein
MKIIITETQDEKLTKLLERMINSELTYLNDNIESFDWGVQDALAMVDNIKVHHIHKDSKGLNVWVDIYVVIDEVGDYDFLTSEIQYSLRKSFPIVKIFTNEVITIEN